MKIMEEIATGNVQPRLLEVMGQLQDKMANITKMQANYILFLEDTYKKLNNDAPANPDSARVESSDIEGKYFISVGTKNVIQNLPDSDISDDGDANLIDPNNKLNLLRKSDIVINEEENKSGEDFIDITEII
jgi:hypothetical protein